MQDEKLSQNIVLQSVSDSTTTDTASAGNVTVTEVDTNSQKQKTTKKMRKKKYKGDKTYSDDIGTFDDLYNEYEEELEKSIPNIVGEKEPFHKRIQRLMELIALSAKKKPPKMAKNKMEIPVESDPIDEEMDQIIEDLNEEISTESYHIEKKIKLEKKLIVQRTVQLENSLCIISIHKKAFMDYVFKCWELEKWFSYKSCNGLPDPTNLQELNRFLYIESLEDSKMSMKNLSRQSIFMTSLIKMINEIIEYPVHSTASTIANYKEVRQKYRDSFQIWIDIASYNLLRQIDRNTVRVDLKNASYVKELASLVCCFWALIKQPISMKQLAEKDRKAVEVTFEEINLTIKIPVDVNCYSSAIRALWISCDYYSDRGTSFFMPEIPNKYIMNMDLFDFCLSEHNELTRIRNEQRDSREQRLQSKRDMITQIINMRNDAKAGTKPDKSRKKKKGKNVAEVQSEQLILPELNLSSPEEIILQNEDEMRKEKRRLLFRRCKKTEINLRKYMILGGIYQIDLLHQPPQPKDFRQDIFLTTLKLPKQLEFVEFSRPYKAPATVPESERTPEVIEAEIKAMEASMEALVLVTLKLPETVLWLEPPLVAHWIADKQIWSTENVHDIKYNEEKQTITFRSGKLGIHGLAGYRFINLPFQSWELKPESDRNSGNGVILSITGAIIQLEFLIREDLISLHSVVGGESSLQNLIGVFSKLHVLIHNMRSSGCDFFPEQDAASYLKGLTLKHPVAVSHLQSCMSLLSTAFIFSWSRWNITRGHREIVLQFKEVHGCLAKEKSNAVLLVTPFQTSVVQCTEISSAFSTEPADENNEFYADVYNFALHNCGIKSLQAMKNISSNLSITVEKLLEATNIINMSA